VPIGVEVLWKSAKLVWKSWADEVVVYNIVSGNSHLLSPTAVKVLKLLETRPLGTSEISEQLARSENVSVDAEITLQVEKLLSSLDELGLVEPAQ
jgi:PqqD family protein of HPr-rel-A system